MGLISFVGAILLVSSTNKSPKNLTQVEFSTTSNSPHPVLGNQYLADGSAVTGQNGNRGNAGTPQTEGVKDSGSTLKNVQSRSSTENSIDSNQTEPPISSSPSTSTPSRTGYNLNETWYLATAGAEGLFNSCWPMELNESNEAQCIDENNPYSHYWFEGVGVSKSAEEAQEFAATQMNQKAYDQHIDLRRGGGDDAVILTEALCSTYDLDCGRW